MSTHVQGFMMLRTRLCRRAVPEGRLGQCVRGNHYCDMRLWLPRRLPPLRKQARRRALVQHMMLAFTADCGCHQPWYQGGAGRLQVGWQGRTYHERVCTAMLRTTAQGKLLVTCMPTCMPSAKRHRTAFSAWRFHVNRRAM